MVDKDAIYEDLLKAFMQYQYRLETPFPSPDDTEEKLIRRYRTDAMFHARVDNLASGVMHILGKHLHDTKRPNK